MAEKVKIQKGTSILKVSLKAFEAVYKAKGFSLVGKPGATVDDEPESDEPASLAADAEAPLVGEQATAPPTAPAKPKHKGKAKASAKSKGGAKADSGGAAESAEGKGQV